MSFLFQSRRLTAKPYSLDEHIGFILVRVPNKKKIVLRKAFTIANPINKNSDNNVLQNILNLFTTIARGSFHLAALPVTAVGSVSSCFIALDKANKPHQRS